MILKPLGGGGALKETGPVNGQSQYFLGYSDRIRSELNLSLAKLVRIGTIPLK